MMLKMLMFFLRHLAFSNLHDPYTGMRLRPGASLFWGCCILVDVASILVSRMPGFQSPFFTYFQLIFFILHPSQHHSKHPGSIL